MPSCIFDTCCGCIELRSGCLIIGYLNLIFEVIMMIITLVALIGGGVVASGAVGTDENVKHQDIGLAIIVISVILLLVLLFFFAFTVVLLVGIHKEKRGHVKVYLIVAVILLVLGVILTLVGLSQHFNAGDFISKIIAYLINIYFLLVIRSYYYKMDDKRPAIYNTA